MTTVSDIFGFVSAAFPEARLSGDGETPVAVACSLAYRKAQGVAFYRRKRWATAEPEVDGLALLITDEEGANAIAPKRGAMALLQVANPRLAFIEVARHYFAPKVAPAVHPTASIAASAKVDPTAYVGPFVYVGERVEIGARTVLDGHIFVGDDTVIGSGCYLAPGVKIGQPGFGYERNEAGELVQFPHIGRVVIGDDVHVGANTCIDRGTLDDTRIRARARVDNLCHISHNVDIGEDTAVIANSMIGGSVKIGPKSWVAPSASVINGVALGERVTVGMAAVVVKPVGDNETVVGSPAKPLEEYKQLQKRLRELPG